MEEQDSSNLDWSGEFNLDDFLPISPGETPRQAPNSSSVPGDPSDPSSHLPPDSLAALNARLSEHGDSSSGSASVPWSSMSKEAREQASDPLSTTQIDIYDKGVGYWVNQGLIKIQAGKQMLRKSPTNSHNSQDIPLTYVPIRASASPVAPHQYHCFFVGQLDFEEGKRSKVSKNEDNQLLSVSYQALSNGKVWWWNDERGVKDKKFIYGSCCRQMGKKTRKGKLTNVEHGFAGKFYSLIRVERAHLEEDTPKTLKNAPFHSIQIASVVTPESYGLVQFWEDIKNEPADKKRSKKDLNKSSQKKKQKKGSKSSPEHQHQLDPDHPIDPDELTQLPPPDNHNPMSSTATMEPTLPQQFFGNPHGVYMPNNNLYTHMPHRNPQQNHQQAIAAAFYHRQRQEHERKRQLYMMEMHPPTMMNNMMMQQPPPMQSIPNLSILNPNGQHSMNPSPNNTSPITNTNPNSNYSGSGSRSDSNSHNSHNSQRSHHSHHSHSDPASPLNSGGSSNNSSDNGINNDPDQTIEGNLLVKGNVIVLGNIHGTLKTSPTAADYAEQFLKEDAENNLIVPGSVVQLNFPSLKLTLKTSEVKGVIMVVSTNPSISAGVNEEAMADGTGAMCAFVGVVPIRVKGKVKAGAELIPSGLEDGCAISSASHLAPLNHQFRCIGVAMESTPSTVIDRTDCESRILCLIHPQSAHHPSASDDDNGTKNHDSSESAPLSSPSSTPQHVVGVKKNKVVPTASIMAEKIELKQFPKTHEDEFEDFPPISAEFSKLELLSRRRPFVIPLAVSLMMGIIAMYDCWGIKEEKLQNLVQKSITDRLATELYEEHKFTRIMTFLSALGTFFYHAMWSNFDMMQIIKNIDSRQALKYSLQHHVFQAASGTLVLLFSAALAAAGIVIKADWNEGTSATDPFYYFSLSSNAVLVLFWVSLLTESLWVTATMRNVCNSIKNDFEARKKFCTFAAPHLKHLQGIEKEGWTITEMRRTITAKPIIFVSCAAMSLFLYNPFFITLIAPSVVVGEKLGFWLGKDTFALYQWADIKRVNTVQSNSTSVKAKFFELQTDSPRRSDNRSENRSSNSEIQPSSASSEVGAIKTDRIKLKFFRGWKSVLLLCFFNAVNYTIITSLQTHNWNSFENCINSTSDEPLSMDTLECYEHVTSGSATWRDIEDEMRSFGFSVKAHDICNANPSIRDSLCNGDCTLSDTLPDGLRVVIPDTCSYIPYDVLKECFRERRFNSTMYIIYHSFAFALFAWAVRSLLVERRMSGADPQGRARRYATKAETFLVTFLPFIMVAHLNASTFDRELSQDYVLNFFGVEEKEGEGVKASLVEQERVGGGGDRWWETVSESSTSQNGGVKRAAKTGGKLWKWKEKMILRNRLIFVASLFAMMTMILVTLTVTYFVVLQFADCQRTFHFPFGSAFNPLLI
ncbi:hypothetical protein TrLO_g15597 [Triparma laevis f. longispina]|uniref:Uncharacterized protein n=1 Tax=Triparma laevis f. longispina TaxID=1714387 RepID=A0A9W7KSS6_9STRA|nr:hypothetical protein TrLO_g15597 [Triparma laevis f. longispina]